MGEKNTETQAGNDKDSHLIVGVGASAGGLDAYKALLSALPSRTGMTFLFVQHLDPQHKSLLAELLQPLTDMRVVEADQGLPLEPDTVFIIRPGTALGIVDGHLEVSEPREQRGHRLPVDHLFRSIARGVGSRSVGVVLSGAGRDGSAGLRDVKVEGGLTIAQDPATCQHASMPDSSIATGYVDIVAKLEDMPDALARFAALPTDQRIENAAAREVRPAAKTPEKADVLGDEELDTLAELLEDIDGPDLRVYKAATLARRITRRRVLSGIENTRDYIDRLREDESERRALVRDLLISVTDFFRDSAAFEILQRELLEPWLRDATIGTLRCWVAGCATGEEAYSIAIAALDAVDALDAEVQVQVFATDLDVDALAIARAGEYAAEIRKRLSSERLKKYFNRLENGNYRVKSRLRDVVSFAIHDLTKDPPFSRMLLVSCRNVLIYLRPAAQERVLRDFHFALRPKGCLLLGSSESIAPVSEHFTEVSKKWRLYRKPADGRSLIARPAAIEPRRYRPKHLEGATFRRPQRPRVDDSLLRLMLELRVPPSVVVAESDEIVYMHGDLRPYLDFPQGEHPRLNFSQMLSEGLATRAKAAVYKCRRSGESVVAVSGPAGEVPRIRIEASPASQVADGYVLVSFESLSGENSEKGTAPTSRADPAFVDDLERELVATREDLRHTAEELESANEDLRSSNEEAMSMNEELQSSNEELEATTEELRSLNEELTTVNAQLREKIEQLERAHDDLANFFGSTKIATLFLDEHLALNRFTPAAGRLLELTHSDIGRRVTDIARDLLQEDLAQQAANVLDDLTPISQEIESSARLVRRDVQPYRTENHRIAGVVVTFIDVTELKRADDLRRRLAAIVEFSDDAIISKNLHGIIQSWNSGAERLFGYAADEMIGRPITVLEPEHRRGEMKQMLERLRSGQHIEHFETERVARDGRIIDVSLTVSPMLDADGVVVGASKVARDITARVRTENALRENEQRLRALVDTQVEMLCRFRADGTILFVNEAYARAQGTAAEDLVGRISGDSSPWMNGLPFAGNCVESLRRIPYCASRTAWKRRPG